jgi:ketosteroid isomerase-like protein
MSQENVQVVRSFYDALDRFLDAYWKEPRPLARAFQAGSLFPEAAEMLAYEHPEIEWKPWSGRIAGTFRGHRKLMEAWDDWLDQADAYRVAIEEVVDIGDDRVLAVVTLDYTAKITKIRVTARVFTVYTVREGLIVRVAEYSDRAEALDAIGSSEQDARADS